MLPALASVLYGLAMIGGGIAGYRFAKSVASLISGAAIGAGALTGGLLMFAGSASGRGLALFASTLAVLFFGWKLSRGILTRTAIGRAGGILALSLIEVAILLLGLEKTT